MLLLARATRKDYRAASKAHQSPFCIFQCFVATHPALGLTVSVSNTSLLQAVDRRDLQAACSGEGYANVLETMREAEKASGLKNKER